LTALQGRQLAMRLGQGPPTESPTELGNAGGPDQAEVKRIEAANTGPLPAKRGLSGEDMPISPDQVAKYEAIEAEKAKASTQEPAKRHGRPPKNPTPATLPEPGYLDENENRVRLISFLAGNRIPDAEETVAKWRTLHMDKAQIEVEISKLRADAWRRRFFAQIKEWQISETDAKNLLGIEHLSEVMGKGVELVLTELRARQAELDET
jgi:hypothetical protein